MRVHGGKVNGKLYEERNDEVAVRDSAGGDGGRDAGGAGAGADEVESIVATRGHERGGAGCGAGGEACLAAESRGRGEWRHVGG